VVTGSVSPAEAWDQLRHLGPVIDDLERTGQAEGAAAVRRARELAESALRGSRHTEPPALLTTRQAGRVLGVSIQTVRNWVAAGRLPAEKRGVRTMIPRQAVLDEIERSRAWPVPAVGDDARSCCGATRSLVAPRGRDAPQSWTRRCSCSDRGRAELRN